MDLDLVLGAQKGDQQAFERLAVANHPRLFRVAYGILRDRHLAEDATQQAFLDIWRTIRRLRDPAKFEAWSYRLLVRTCHAEVKRRPDWSQLTGSRPPLSSSRGMTSPPSSIETNSTGASADSLSNTARSSSSVANWTCR